jgi:MFS family permease
MAGNLVGPLIGGALPPLIGIRGTFFAAGAMIFVAFLATAFLIKEEKKAPARKQATRPSGGWASIPTSGLSSPCWHRHAADARQHVDRADHHRLRRARWSRIRAR